MQSAQSSKPECEDYGVQEMAKDEGSYSPSNLGTGVNSLGSWYMSEGRMFLGNRGRNMYSVEHGSAIHHRGDFRRARLLQMATSHISAVSDMLTKSLLS